MMPMNNFIFPVRRLSPKVSHLHSADRWMAEFLVEANALNETFLPFGDNSIASCLGLSRDLGFETFATRF
jgi:hypothetical protein